MADNIVVEYKTELLKAICGCKEAVDIIDSQSPTFDKTDPYSLIANSKGEGNLYTWLKIPKTITRADCYILVSVQFRNITQRNPTFGRYRVGIRLLCHDARMPYTKANGNRLDLLYGVLKTLFEQNPNFGVNRLEMNSRIEDSYDETFNVIEMEFFTDDLRYPVSPSGKPWRQDYYGQ